MMQLRDGVRHLAVGDLDCVATLQFTQHFAHCFLRPRLSEKLQDSGSEGLDGAWLARAAFHQVVDHFLHRISNRTCG